MAYLEGAWLTYLARCVLIFKVTGNTTIELIEVTLSHIRFHNLSDSIDPISLLPFRP